MVAIMKGIWEYLPTARAMVALFDSMPIEEQMRLAEASLM
jgi:hypothetical protein